MGGTPRESAQKPLILTLWGSRFVDLKCAAVATTSRLVIFWQLFRALLELPFWPHNGHTYPQGIRGDCKEIRRGVVDTVKPQGQHTRARHVSRVAQGTRLRDQRAEIWRSTPALI